MALQSSMHFDGGLFQKDLFSSRSTRAAFAMNLLLFVGLAAMLYRRWEHFPGYCLLLSAGIVVGSLTSWLRVRKEHQAIRSFLKSQGSALRADIPEELQCQLLRSAEALIHLTTFYWVMGAFLAVLAIDQASR
ncbi:MAG: hypothetical protein KatS3mg005_3990 [Bryobacteraceae bacterium]|nr:MAG: hypothetical protein KatS3mg004_0400 [Bryobacteraceae bacterium]GIU80752.1 MAG: hypothetical protein KatS3mg005_3990 [Bryobacteraceae bacterium]